MEFLRLFLRHHFAGKPGVASWIVACFLRLLGNKICLSSSIATGPPFLSPFILFSSSYNSITSSAWSVFDKCQLSAKLKKSLERVTELPLNFHELILALKCRGLDFDLRSKYPSLLLGYSTSPRLSESTRPHRETHDVGVDELRETHWNQVNRIARHGPCRFCVRRLLCSS